jgi:hypothetical protein
MRSTFPLHWLAAAFVALLPAGVFILGSDQPRAKRLDARQLSVLLGGACQNRGPSGTWQCVTSQPPNGADCNNLQTTCGSVNGTCQMIQPVNGAACGNMQGYENCKMNTLATMCANILTGTKTEQGDCPTCNTPTNTTCGSLQVQCNWDECAGS